MTRAEPSELTEVISVTLAIWPRCRSSGLATVVATSYYGSRSEGFDSTGGKSEAKWVGPCK